MSFVNKNFTLKALMYCFHYVVCGVPFSKPSSRIAPAVERSAESLVVQPAITLLRYDKLSCGNKGRGLNKEKGRPDVDRAGLWMGIRC